jgi:hypothetical protein
MSEIEGEAVAIEHGRRGGQLVRVWHRAVWLRIIACKLTLARRPILTGPLRASGELNVWAGMKERAPRGGTNKGTGRNKKVHII